jgi:hypothetical protein
MPEKKKRKPLKRTPIKPSKKKSYDGVKRNVRRGVRSEIIHGGEQQEDSSDASSNKDKRNRFIGRKDDNSLGNWRGNGMDASRLVPSKKSKAPKKTKKATGEAIIFKQIWEEAIEKAFPEVPRCACCSTVLGSEAKSFFFSHVLAKSTYPLFRLWAINVWLCCLACHQEWDQGDRSQPKFKAKRLFAEKLKALYYKIKDLPREEQQKEMLKFKP